MHTLEELKSELSMPTSSKVQLGSSMLHSCTASTVAKTKLPAHGVFREVGRGCHGFFVACLLTSCSLLCEQVSDHLPRVSLWVHYVLYSVS